MEGNPFRIKAAGCFVQIIGAGMVLCGVIILFGQGRINSPGIFVLLVGLLPLFMGAKATRSRG